jgi:hypothetical protein
MFGQSMGILEAATQSVRTKPVGKLGEAVFDCPRCDMGQTAIYLMIESIPVKSSFPNIARRIQKLSPSWRSKKRVMHQYLKERLEESRERTRARGDGAADLADCALGELYPITWIVRVTVS